MTNQFKNNSLTKKRGEFFDWKIFFVTSIFFFVALINIRDFPINNVPLIYPAFFFFAILIGPHNIFKGFRRTKFLCILIIAYWSYFRMLVLIKGGSIELGNLAYLLEPLMILGAVGAVTIKPGGTKAALWALVSVITLSTAFGIWIYFIGEPVASWRSTLHSTTGGNILHGEFLRDIDTAIDQAAVVGKNTGLSYYIFIFSYQIAAALLIILISLLSMRRAFSKKYLYLWGGFIIMFLGVITNTERATVLSVPIGLISFFLIKKKKIMNLRTIMIFIICIFVVLTLLSYSSKWEASETIHGRITVLEEIYLRGTVIPLAAIKSVLSEPLGASGLSDYYVDVAYRVGWVSRLHGPKSPHNHFANVIMYTGIVGIFITILLFRGLWKKIKYVRLSASGEEEVILAVVCITCIVHSFTHNTGFFTIEPATLIVFGLLWGATSLKGARKFKQSRTGFYMPYNTFIRKINKG